MRSIKGSIYAQSSISAGIKIGIVQYLLNSLSEEFNICRVQYLEILIAASFKTSAEFNIYIDQNMNIWIFAKINICIGQYLHCPKLQSKLQKYLQMSRSAEFNIWKCHCLWRSISAYLYICSSQYLPRSIFAELNICTFHYLQNSISAECNTCRVQYLALYYLQNLISADCIIYRVWYLLSSISVEFNIMQIFIHTVFNIFQFQYLQSFISAEFNVCIV